MSKEMPPIGKEKGRGGGQKYWGLREREAEVLQLETGETKT